jgi:hypothetical protein
MFLWSLFRKFLGVLIAPLIQNNILIKCFTLSLLFFIYFESRSYYQYITEEKINIYVWTIWNFLCVNVKSLLFLWFRLFFVWKQQLKLQLFQTKLTRKRYHKDILWPSYNVGKFINILYLTQWTIWLQLFPVSVIVRYVYDNVL